VAVVSAGQYAKSSFAPCSRQITMSAPHHPIFFTSRMLFLTPNQQCQSTAGISTAYKPPYNSTYIYNKAIVDSRLRPRCKICCHRIRRQSQAVWRHLANTLDIYDYLLEHGAHVDTTTATRYRAQCRKTRRQPVHMQRTVK